MLDYSRNLKKPSRELRKNMTDAERLLWSKIRGKQILGVQFYRQKPIGPYIVDFYAHVAGLVIEVDGGQHYEPEHALRDMVRDKYLSDIGMRVMRFDNGQVLHELDAVVAAIYSVIEERQIPPCPPLQSGVNANSKFLVIKESSAAVDSKSPFEKGDTGGFAAEPVMISALEHYSYCPRQCALIHVEQTFHENLYTMRGRDVHENVDVESSHALAGVRYERALPIWSRQLNLVGKADMVEFHGEVPYPVEYKSGRHRAGLHEILQLLAQAVCLEEMFGVPVPKGALYWHGSRERMEIVFTEAMRLHLEEVVVAVHAMVAGNHVPPPVNDKRCKDCSLKESCLPHVVGEKGRSRKAAHDLYVN